MGVLSERWCFGRAAVLIGTLCRRQEDLDQRIDRLTEVSRVHGGESVQGVSGCYLWSRRLSFACGCPSDSISATQTAPITQRYYRLSSITRLQLSEKTQYFIKMGRQEEVRWLKEVRCSAG